MLYKNSTKISSEKDEEMKKISLYKEIISYLSRIIEYVSFIYYYYIDTLVSA
jgi:hypothetical protein